MKKQLLLTVALLLFCFVGLNASGNLPLSLSGTYLVGSGQPVFKKLTDIASTLNDPANTVTGNIIFELDSDYDGTTGETFPIVFKQFKTAGDYTVTIRPKEGVSLRTTCGDPGEYATLIMLDGTDKLQFDGRAGGIGNSIGWLIRNIRSGGDVGYALYLKNTASLNVFTYLQLEAQSANSCSVVYLGAGVLYGNNYNTISYCTVSGRSDTMGMTAACIISRGTSSQRPNVYNIILHNNIVNFYRSGTPAYGVYLGGGTTETQVTYNNFYNTQSVTDAAAGTALYAIYVSEPAVNFTSVSSNAIGGSAPGCAGAPFLLSGANVRFGGIVFENTQPNPIGAVTDNRVHNNVITNLQIASDTAPDAGQLFFTGIQMSSSYVALGITDNTIGSSTENDAIQLSMGGVNAFSASMIHFTAVNGGYITGNKIGGITFSGSVVSASPSTVNGIYVAFSSGNQGVFAINNNLVGSIAVANSIRSVSGTLPLGFTGINTNIGVSSAVSYKNNTISGILVNYSGTVPADLIGIRHYNNAGSVIDSNIISDLSSASMAVTNTLNFEGIYLNGGNGVVSNNIIRRLRRTATGVSNGTVGNNLGGITVSNPFYSTQVYNNRIYDLTSANNLGADAFTGLTGIRIARPSVVYNNVIALDNGSNINNCVIVGMTTTTSLVTAKIFHNTVYIGGNNPDVSNAFSIAMGGVPVTASGPIDIRNNIFVNARTGSRNYIYYNALTLPATHWPDTAIDYNVLITADVNRVTKWQSSDLDSAQWRAGGDRHSSIYTASQLPPSVLFSNVSDGNLGIQVGARLYVAGKGVAGAGVTSDFAGQIRNTTTPTAGAYEYVVPQNPVVPVITSYGGALSTVLQVAENTTGVATVTATDANDSRIIYSIVAGDDGSFFTVDNSTGELTFRTAPDFEHPADPDENNIYLVTVQAYNGMFSSVQRFKVRVVNVNDKAPEIGSYDGDISVSLSIPENTIAVGTVWAVDWEPGTTITYSIVDEKDGSKFSVNSITGEFSFITPPDFENPLSADGGNVYIVTVQASDGLLASYQRFKLKVTDVDESAGRFSNKGVNKAEVQEQTILQTETGSGGSIKVYPSPVLNKRFSLQMNNIALGRYLLEVYSASGQLVYRQLLNIAGKSIIYPIQLPEGLSRGMYMLKFKGAKITFSEKLFIE